MITHAHMHTHTHTLSLALSVTDSLKTEFLPQLTAAAGIKIPLQL